MLHSEGEEVGEGEEGEEEAPSKLGQLHMRLTMAPPVELLNRQKRSAKDSKEVTRLIGLVNCCALIVCSASSPGEPAR